jgi:hypothetical protein
VLADALLPADRSQSHERDYGWLRALMAEHYAGDDTNVRRLAAGILAAYAGSASTISSSNLKPSCEAHNILDGRIRAVPRGVMAAANVIAGARGGVDIPASDVDRLKNHMAKYYKKFGETPPWDA